MGGSRQVQFTKSSSIFLLLILQAVNGRCMDNEAGRKSFYIANDTFYKDASPYLSGRRYPLLPSASAGSNLEGYLKLIQKLDLLVMLRIGPYICAEWDFGGFPAWLLAVQPELRLRTSDPQYLKLVYSWWDVLLPKLVPYLYCQQGPVIMVQVENEYGSFGDDKSYIQNLVAKVRAHLGEDILLYTTDGAVLENLEHGTLKGNDVYTAVDFPTEWDPAAAFNVPGKSPSLSSEFYTGWLTHWGELPAYTDPKFTAAALDRILSLNASVVLYDAPIGEAGDVDSPKFQALKAIVARYSQGSLPDPPLLPARKAFGSLQLEKRSSLFHILGSVSTVPGGVQMDQPRPMETLHQVTHFPLKLYSLSVHYLKQNLYFSRCQGLYCTEPLYLHLRKREVNFLYLKAQVFVSRGDEEYEPLLRRYMHIGTLERWSTDTLWLPSSAGVPGLQLDILVENMGRVNYGPYLYDRKGITSGVFLDDMPIFDWISFSIPLDSTFPTVAGLVSRLKTQRPHHSVTAEYSRNWTDGPSFYQGQLSVDAPADTFLSIVGWSKGVAFLNGFNLGRYWPVKGPQCTLYIPAPLLHVGVNQLLLLELEEPDKHLWVNFTDVGDYSCKKGSRGLEDFYEM